MKLLFKIKDVLVLNRRLSQSQAHFCFCGDFTFIKIMTYELLNFHIIQLIYKYYLIKLSIELQDLGMILLPNKISPRF